MGSALTSPGADASPQSRNANSLLIEDTVNWLKGSHAISVGGSFTQFDIWAKNGTLVPRINFGVLGNDPANGLFNGTNFPGSSPDQQTAARNLFALLTGRVNSIGADARLDESGKYVYIGESMQRGRLREYGMFAQDSWRLKQNLTLNLGLRYDIQQPFYPLNSLYSQANIDRSAACPVQAATTPATCSSRAACPASGRPTTSTARARKRTTPT